MRVECERNETLERVSERFESLRRREAGESTGNNFERVHKE